MNSSPSPLPELARECVHWKAGHRAPPVLGGGDDPFPPARQPRPVAATGLRQGKEARYRMPAASSRPGRAARWAGCCAGWCIQTWVRMGPAFLGAPPCAGVGAWPALAVPGLACRTPTLDIIQNLISRYPLSSTIHLTSQRSTLEETVIDSRGQVVAQPARHNRLRSVARSTDRIHVATIQSVSVTSNALTHDTTRCSDHHSLTYCSQWNVIQCRKHRAACHLTNDDAPQMQSSAGVVIVADTDPPLCSAQRVGTTPLAA